MSRLLKLSLPKPRHGFDLICRNIEVILVGFDVTVSSEVSRDSLRSQRLNKLSFSCEN